MVSSMFPWAKYEYNSMGLIWDDVIQFADPKDKLIAEIRKFSSMSAENFLLYSIFPVSIRRLFVQRGCP